VAESCNTVINSCGLQKVGNAFTSSVNISYEEGLYGMK